MTTHPHLLLLTHSYTPEDTAPQRRWSSFIQELTAAGYRVTVVAPEPRKDHRSWGTDMGDYGETIVRVPGAQSAKTRTGRLMNNVLGSLASVPRALAVRNVDLVIGTVPALTTASVGLLVAKLKRRPFILDMRDAWPDLAHDAQLPRSLLRSTMEAVLQYCQRAADTVITVTEGFGQALTQRGVGNVVCVPNGLTTMEPKVETHPGILRQPALQVLYVGNHGESQGLDIILSAAALAGDKVFLTMVGEGTQKMALQEYAKELNAPVEFVDQVTAGQLCNYYENADTAVVSLRPDWSSFRWTIPSKTYELLGIGRRLTAMVRGEAADLVQRFQPDSVVPAEPAAIAEYWVELADHPERLVVDDCAERLGDHLPATRVNALKTTLEKLLNRTKSRSLSSA